MKKYIRSTVLSTALTMLTVSTVNSASVSALISNDRLAVSDSAQVSLFLNLMPGEEASVFEGVFDFLGLNSVASVSLSSGGPSWSSSFGNIVGDQALLSLTSNNDGSTSRLLGNIDVMALNPGTFDVVFNDATFAAFDIDVNPFIEDLALDNFNGQVLASATVVPLPAALVLFLSGLSGLALVSRRRLIRR